jgi:hypothetical protein
MTALTKTHSSRLPFSPRLLCTGALLAVSLSAHADYRWHESGYAWRHGHHHHGDYYGLAPVFGVEGAIGLAPSYPVYVPPRVYYPAPRYYAPPVYAAPVTYYSAPMDGTPLYWQHSSQPGANYAQPYAPIPSVSGGVLLNRAMLGAAGGLIGSQIGHGDGRAAATAAGAVAGWVLGGSLGR